MFGRSPALFTTLKTTRTTFPFVSKIGCIRVNLIIIPRLRIRGAITPFRNTPSWRDAWGSTGTALPLLQREVRYRPIKSPTILRTTTCLTVESEKLSLLHGDSLCWSSFWVGRTANVHRLSPSWSPRYGGFVLYEGWSEDSRNWQWKQYLIKIDLFTFEMSSHYYHKTCGNSFIFFVLRVNTYIRLFIHKIYRD
jgi:hypothetical protein